MMLVLIAVKKFGGNAHKGDDHEWENTVSKSHKGRWLSYVYGKIVVYQIVLQL